MLSVRARLVEGGGGGGLSSRSSVTACRWEDLDETARAAAPAAHSGVACVADGFPD